MTKSLGKSLYGTGNHFEWGENQIVKLYGPDVPKDWIKALGQREKQLFEAGLPVPEVGELVEIDDNLGQVYERIDGKPMTDELLTITDVASEKIVALAHTFAEVHAKIHALQDVQVDMPKQKAFFPTVLKGLDSLPSDLSQALLKALETIPDGDRICHGDYHPYNVLLSPKGPIVIDWNNAHIGNPLEDVARTKLILTGFSIMYPPLAAVIERFKQLYLDHYFRLRPNGREQLAAWWPIVAAVRLRDNISEIQPWLLDQIRTCIEQ
jgi:uncharacterized protein (TIGR02172 family)